MTPYRRHLALSLSIFALAALAFAGLLYWQGARTGAASARDHLDTIRLTQHLVETQQARDLETRAELIADNQAVTGYVGAALGGSLPGVDIDRASITDLLEERRSQLGLAAVAVIDNDGGLVAGAALDSTQQQFGTEPAFVAARKSRKVETGLWIDGTRMLHIAIRPLLAYGAGDAYLLVGMPVNQGFAETIARIGATDVALVARSPDGPLTLASTLEPAEQVALQAQLVAKAGSPEGHFDIEYAARHYDATVSPLFGSKDASLVALITPHRDMASFAAAALPMLVGSVLSLLAIALASQVLWSRVSGPAADLARVLEHAANSGDFQLHAPEGGARAIARIGTALNRLLGRLQR